MFLLPPPSLDTAYRHAPGFEYTVKQVPAGHALISPQRRQIVVLNDVGFYLFTLLRKKQTVRALIAAVKREFSPGPRTNVKKDVWFYLRDLHKKKIIQTVGRNATTV